MASTSESRTRRRRPASRTGSRRRTRRKSARRKPALWRRLLGLKATRRRTTRKSSARSTSSKRTPTKRSTAKRAPAKRTTTKRTTAKRTTAKRTTAKRTAPKKTTARATPAKRARTTRRRTASKQPLLARWMRRPTRRPARCKSGGRRRTTRQPGLIWRVARWSAIALIWGVVVMGAGIAYYAYDLPSLDDALAQTRRSSVVVRAADGGILATYGDYHGGALDYEDLPPRLIEAVLATEDRRFFDHPGIDILGIMRAAASNIMAGDIVAGGSTISQQLAKNLFLTSERTVRRKVQEALLALWIEQRFSKQQILTIYLNRVYFGAGTYGVEAASQRFFGHTARTLSLPEAAILAGLLKAPSRFNPAANPDRAQDRAAVVLESMVDADFITPELAGMARSAVVRYAAAGGAQANRPSLYFADWAADQAVGLVGAAQDLTVITTLDRGAQAAAAAAVAATLRDHGLEQDVAQAAVVVMDLDGAVRAMVGGRDYRNSQFNRATDALRQPGSSFKLMLYLAALERGMTPDSSIDDSPISIGGWSPANYDGNYRGVISVREAFARSLNAAAVRLIQAVGPAEVRSLAHRLGLSTDLPATPSLALGAGEVRLIELTAAYATVANGGTGVAPYGIAEIRGRDGQVLYRAAPGELGRQLSSGVAAQMHEMLSAAVAWGTGAAAALPGVPVAGKTGTSQDYRDAWFVGYTPGRVAGVWMGNDDNAPMRRVTGGGLPAELWHDVMMGMP